MSPNFATAAPIREGVPADCFTPQVKAVMVEFAETADLTNFDKEVDHAQMKFLLKSAGSRVPAFGTAAAEHMGASVGFEHAHEDPNC